MRLDINTPIGAATAVVLLSVIALTVIHRGFMGPKAVDLMGQQNIECKGQPLEVDYPYHGGFLDPHACKIQCEDGILRYIVYTNGKATQCDTTPGECLDWGEDHGFTCVIPE